jgi:hypothetical protein
MSVRVGIELSAISTGGKQPLMSIRALSSSSHRHIEVSVSEHKAPCLNPTLYNIVASQLEPLSLEASQHDPRSDQDQRDGRRSHQRGRSRVALVVVRGRSSRGGTSGRSVGTGLACVGSGTGRRGGGLTTGRSARSGRGARSGTRRSRRRRGSVARRCRSVKGGCPVFINRSNKHELTHPLINPNPSPENLNSRNVLLDIRMRNVQPLRDRNDMLKRSLKVGQKLDRLAHREIVQLVGEHDRPPGVITPILGGIDHALIIGIDLLAGDGRVPGVDPPIVRIGLPQDRGQVQGLGDHPDSVVDVPKGRSEVNGSDAGDELDGFLSVVELGKDLFIGHGRQVSARTSREWKGILVNEVLAIR